MSQQSYALVYTQVIDNKETLLYLKATRHMEQGRNVLPSLEAVTLNEMVASLHHFPMPYQQTKLFVYPAEDGASQALKSLRREARFIADGNLKEVDETNFYKNISVKPLTFD